MKLKRLNSFPKQFHRVGAEPFHFEVTIFCYNDYTYEETTPFFTLFLLNKGENTKLLPSPFSTLFF